jgi:hypothetical protein
LIGDTVSYKDQTTGDVVTGAVNSVQITSSGPTLTVNGVAGVNPAIVTNVTGPSNSSSTGTGTGTSTSDSGTGSSDSGTSGSGS